MKLNPESLARASSHHPWRVIVAWIVLMVAMGAASATLLGGVLTNDIAFTNSPESIRAQDVVDEKFSEAQAGASTEFVIVQSDDGQTVDDPAYAVYVKKLQGALAGTDLLAAPPTTYFDAAAQAPEQAAGLVSQDKTATLIPIAIADDGTASIEDLRSLIDHNTADGFTTQLAGQATLNADFSTVAEEDARKGESIGIMVALVVLVVVFGALVAATVPIGMAIAAIFIALGITSLVGQLVEFNLFVTNIITMIGLAVGIDYSLFIVSRFREERRKGFDKLEAIGAAGATASRAVFFSGMTVVLALLGMFIIPTTIFRALAAGAIFVTLVSIAASMTLLPAVLAKLGDRTEWPYLSRLANVGVFLLLFIVPGVVGGIAAAVGAPAILTALLGVAAFVGFIVVLSKAIRRGSPAFLQRFLRETDTEVDPRGGFWDRMTRRVMARPVVFLVVGVLILGGLGSFYFQLNKGSSTGVAQLPDSMESKAAFLTLEKQFAGGLTDPALIIVTGDVNNPQVDAAVTKLQDAIAADPSFAPGTQVATSKDGSAIQVSAFFKGETQNDAATAAIRDLRSRIVPAAFAGVPGVDVLVGGNTAIFTDFLSVTDTYQWIVLAFVLGLSFLLLMVVFRSIVVPIKAIIMNLLSVAAAYGAVTLVFQKGVGIGFFNSIGFHFHQSEAIEAWLPLFLFSILFGLSMDYHVFLLSRIREEYDKTHDNTEAVAYGLRTTAAIITGAAIIMVVVFTGFASGSLGPLQQMGFGLAVAVLMDATIVRVFLVPASMRLLGDRNWYLPSWLQWLPKLNVEGHEPELVSLPESATSQLVEAGDKD
jgi:RND superfamily putative drug exporter